MSRNVSGMNFAIRDDPNRKGYHAAVSNERTFPANNLISLHCSLR
jgi:hypothetical protein